MRYVYTLDYEMPSETAVHKGGMSMGDEKRVDWHPDWTQAKKPPTDLESGHRSASTEDEASDGQRYLPAEQDKMSKLFADRERYVEDRMKELQVRLHGRVSGCAPDRSP